MDGHQVWDGTTRGATLKEWAAQARHTLADCAKQYDWAGVLALLADHPELVNATRPDARSWFAPLHQAAHGGAPVDIAERLVGLGAWRLLRTADDELPVDVARRRGHGHLLEVLRPSPIIDIRADELAGIQQRFHEVIRGRVADLVDKHGLRLPELAVLTESAPPAAWFAVPGMYGGFKYWLESGNSGWRLQSESWWRVVGGSGQRHEISAREAVLVEEGFV